MIAAGASANTIGGTTAGTGNVISGNATVGIDVAAAANPIEGNFIGTNSAGTAAVPNESFGISIVATDVTIGGTSTGAGNLISGNIGGGIDIEADDAVIEGNTIGTDVTGMNPLGVFVAENPGYGADGIDVNSSGNTIGGSVDGSSNLISGNSGDGIFIALSSNLVEGNIIGPAAGGNAALIESNFIGVEFGGTENTIGGTTAAARNVISENSLGIYLVSSTNADNVVEGNYIGLNTAGTAALGNLGSGIQLSGGTGDTIGGTTGAAANVISGNTGAGIVDAEAGEAVIGNLIGTNAAGTAAVPNDGYGIYITQPNVTIGGTAAGDGNLISGNLAGGIFILRGNAAILGNTIGTDITGMNPLGVFVSENPGFGADGIDVASTGNTIGGTVAGSSNLISGNSGSGVNITGDGNLVSGNLIGVNQAGAAALANGVGVTIEDNATHNSIGPGDVISGNDGDGVSITGIDNLVRGEFIGVNSGGMSAIPNGGVGIDVVTSSTATGSSTTGTTTIGPGNIISANSIGILDIANFYTDLSIVGNTIGGLITNTGAVNSLGGNLEYGIDLNGGGQVTIGGTIAGAGNVIADNPYYGIEVVEVSPNSVLIEGNFIGTDSHSDFGLGNGTGIQVDDSTGATIGGTTVAAANVIAGNTNNGVWLTAGASSNVVEGNFIGTDAAGNPDIGNEGDGVLLNQGAESNTIGGTSAAALNVISGNFGIGVDINGYSESESATTFNLVENNLIGLAPGATSVLGNTIYGVLINDSANNTIGPNNVISGNVNDGVDIANDSLANLVTGNIIGTNTAANVGLGNFGHGVYIDQSSFNNTIGGGDVIGGNFGGGVELDGYQNLVVGESIGLNAGGTPIPNFGDGVTIFGNGNTIGGTIEGAGNTIAFNEGSGVDLPPFYNDSEEQTYAAGDAIRGNSIYSNGVLGIQLGSLTTTNDNVLGGSVSGPNNFENNPALTAVLNQGTGTTIFGDINTTPNTLVYIDLFSNATSTGIYEGQTYLGTVAVSTTVNGNGSFTFTTDSPLPAHSIITATATDASGNTSEFSLFYTEDNPPIASFLAKTAPANNTGQTTFNAGQTVYFDGTASNSPDGDPLTYTWNFGDGSPEVTTNATPTHSYPYDGTYVATLTVNDGHGGIESMTTTLTVDADTPVVTINPLPATVAAGTTLALSGTIQDPSGDPVQVVLNWGDNSPNTTLNLAPGALTFSTSHEYFAAITGTTTIVATATDEPNPSAVAPPPALVPITPVPPFDVAGLSSLTSASLTVTNATPVVQPLSLGSSTINEGDTAELTVTFTDTAPLSDHIVTINWGDGSAPTTQVLVSGVFNVVVPHQYLDDPPTGNDAIAVSVTNAAGQTGTAHTTIAVNDVAPIVSIDPVAMSSSSTLVALVADVIDPGAIETYTYQWSATQNGLPYATGNGRDFSFTSLPGDSYATTVVVTEPDGDTVTASNLVYNGPALANNTIVVSPGGTNQVVIVANGNNLGPFAANSVVVFGNGATNVIKADPTLTTPVELVGSRGGTNTLVGGAGNDTLMTLKGNDVLMGGTGATTFTVIPGKDPTLDGSTALNTIDFTQDTLSVNLDLGQNAGQSQTIDSNGDVVVLNGNFQTLLGGPNGDTIQAGKADTTIVGGGGADLLYAGTVGNDSISGGTGNNTIVGGGGNDIIYSGAGGTNSIQGGTGNATIRGGGGNDIIYAGTTGNASIQGGTGNQTISGGGGNDIIYLGSGTDSIQGGTGNQTIAGGGGNDVIYLGSGTNSIQGGTGNQTIRGGGGNDVVYLGSGTDSIEGGTGNQTIAGGGGNDVIYLGSGTNSIQGGTGNQTIRGGGGNDVIYLGSGTNSIQGGTGNQTIAGGGGNDVIYLGSGTNSIQGGTGNQTIAGGGGNDVIYLGSGTDSIQGGTGNQTIAGGGGNDVIYLGSGTNSIQGGTGNQTIRGGGGNDVIYLGSGTDSIQGGTGNQTIAGGGGNDVIYLGSGINSIQGGTGNQTIAGGGGNDVIYLSSGTDSIQGGTGNQTIAGGGGNDIIYLSSGTDSIQGGTGNQTIAGGGGNDIIYLGSGINSIQGGTGNQTIAGGGGNDVIYLGSGTDSIQGGTGNQTIAGGGGNDVIYLSSGTDSIQGGTGNQTIAGGGGNDVIYLGSGTDSISAGTGNATIVGGVGNDIIYGGGTSDLLIESAAANITLTNTNVIIPGNGSQTFSGITTVELATGNGNFEIDASRYSGSAMLLAGTGNETVLAGSGNDTVVAGTGNDSLVGGGGNDTYIFNSLSQGSDTIVENSTTGNTLDFSQFTAGVTVDIAKSGPQTVSSGLTLNLTNPLGFDQVIGTPYPDTILGNANNDTLIGGGGADYLDGRGGSNLIEGDDTQVVYLDFLTVAGEIDYTQAMRDAIEARLGAIYSAFNFMFTQTEPTAGPFESLVFNEPAGTYLGGEATDLDWRHIDLTGSSSIDINAFLGGQDEPANTLTNIINMTATIAAHELGHLSGLRHGDAFGPIGSGIYANVDPSLFYPAYTGPSNAVETPYHVMGSPGSIGTSLFDATRITFFGEREAIKMAFADSGTTVDEQTAPHGSIATAQALALTPLAVPNTLLLGQNVGQTFNVQAVDVDGAIQLGPNGDSADDYYSFQAQAGQLFNFEVMSQSLTRDADAIIDSTLTVYDSKGNQIAFNDDSFQSIDAVIYDLTMPATGTYYVKVDTFSVTDSNGVVHDSNIGNYDLFMYSFADGTDSGLGDTLVGGTGTDTLVGSSANDLIEIIPGDTVINGSGNDTIDTIPYGLAIKDPAVQLNTPAIFNASLADPNINDVYAWTVQNAAGQIVAATNGVNLSSFSYTPTVDGDFTVTLTVTDTFGASAQTSTLLIAGNPIENLITPVINLNGTPAGISLNDPVGTPITLTGTAQDTSANNGFTFAWTVADGVNTVATGTGAAFSFTPTTLDTYVVTLTATDSNGVASTILSLTPQAVAPTAEIVGVPAHEYAAEGSSITLTGNVSDSTPGATVVETWTVTNNGTAYPFTTTPNSVSFTPESIGLYVVTLTANDRSNGLSAVVGQDIIAIPVAPSASITGGSTTGTSPEGTALSFGSVDSSPSNVVQAAGFNNAWTVTRNGFPLTLPSSVVTNAPTFTFTPELAGLYVVSLSATDENGITSLSATQTINVTGVDPIVAIGGLPANNTTTEGSTLSLAANVSDPVRSTQTLDFSIFGPSPSTAKSTARSTAPLYP